jgi:hypothetical protein
MSVQTVSPVPVYPFGQGLHTRPPTVFMQVDKTLQPPFPVAHSSMSVQVVPSPAYPVLHAQVTPVAVSVQVALALQGLGVAAHVVRTRSHRTHRPHSRRLLGRSHHR